MVKFTRKDNDKKYWDIPKNFLLKVNILDPHDYEDLEPIMFTLLEILEEYIDDRDIEATAYLEETRIKEIE